MLYIFISYYDNTSNQFNKIKSVNKEFVQKIYLEDYLLSPFKISAKDTVYILTNSIRNNDLIGLLKDKCYIINQAFYEKNYDKLLIQNKLKNAGVSVPKIIDINDVDEYSFPIMLKSKKHVDLVAPIEDLEKLNNIVDKRKNNFYLEAKLKYDKEIKVYFVKNRVYFYDNQTLNIDTDKISVLCNLVSKELNLEVFSVDLLICNCELFVVDVNPAAGLYNSAPARERLVNGI